MKQVTKNNIKKTPNKKNSTTKTSNNKDSRLPKLAKPMKEKKKHADFGTSQLEQDFAKDFLDKLGVEYIWQFEAKEIGRFFDYYIIKSNVILEVDGDYWHGYGLVREQMNPTQKKSMRIDREKDAWAALHGIPVIRIWEHDIRNNPSEVMKMLKEKLYLSAQVELKKKEMNKRHINKLNKDGKD